MSYIRAIAVAVLTIAFGLLAATANADMITATYHTGYGQNLASHIQPYDSSTSWGPWFTGAFNITSYTTSPAGAYTISSMGFCIETETIGASGTSTWGIGDVSLAPVDEGPYGTTQPMGSDRGKYLGQLWYRHYDKVVDNVSGAAFQLAVWEIVFETNLAGGVNGDINQPATSAYWDITSGLVAARDDTAARTLAQSWLVDVRDNPNSPSYKLLGLTYNGRQDIIVRDMTQGGGEVPAPSALLLCLIGVGFAGVARRIKRS